MLATMRRDERRFRRLLQNDVADAVRQLRTRSAGTIFVHSLHIDVLRRRRSTGC